MLKCIFIQGGTMKVQVKCVIIEIIHHKVHIKYFPDVGNWFDYFKWNTL